MLRNSHQRYYIEKAALENIAIFIRKKLSWSLFLIKLFQHRCFPANIAKFLRTSILKNICEWLLLNEVFNSNEEQHYLVNKLDENGVRNNDVLGLFGSLWYYDICILSRSSCTEVFFKELFLKISQKQGFGRETDENRADLCLRPVVFSFESGCILCSILVVKMAVKLEVLRNVPQGEDG